MKTKLPAVLWAREDPDLVILARTDSYAAFGLEEADPRHSSQHRRKLNLDMGQLPPTAGLSSPIAMSRARYLAPSAKRRSVLVSGQAFANKRDTRERKPTTELSEVPSHGAKDSLMAGNGRVDATLGALGTQRPGPTISYLASSKRWCLNEASIVAAGPWTVP